MTRTEKIQALRKEGKTFKEIAKIYGITFQRVMQLADARYRQKESYIVGRRHKGHRLAKAQGKEFRPYKPCRLCEREEQT